MMVLKHSTRLLAGVFVLLVLLTSTYGNSGQLQIQELMLMKEVGTDPVGDGGSLDLIAAYMGANPNYLGFIVAYSAPGEFGLWTNITLRNEVGDLFLIMAMYSDSTNYILITGATSLEDDSKNTNEDEIFWELEDKILFNFTELHFALDWKVFGGQQSVDAVFWTDRPVYESYDRLPDTGHITYELDNSTDTTMYIPNAQTITSSVTLDPSNTSIHDETTSENQTSDDVTSQNNDTEDGNLLDEGTGEFSLPVSYVYLLAIPVLLARRKIISHK